MTQHNDLKIFGPTRPNGKARHRSNEAIQNAKHTRQDQTIFGAITHNGPGGVIDSFSYTLDNNGNRTAVTSTEGTENYTLDSLNRITAASYPDGNSEAFSYDAAGNRVSHTKVDGTTVTYSHDAAGQIGSDSTGTDYTYDGAGNLIATSTGDAYVYNPWGNLTSATVDGVTTTAAFDATGTRVTVDGVTQLWDRTGYGQLISTGAGDNYLHNPTGTILRDGDDWLHTDAVGSVRYSTDPTGTVTSTSAFTVYGEPRTTSNSDFGFAGEQTDPTGLVHLRARAYNPGLGSFMAYDPLQPGGPSTAGWNHYSYSANNPTTWTDPTGQAVSVEYGALAKRAAIGAAIGGVISLWTCQNDFSWKGPFGGNDLNGGCVAGSIILGAIFGPIAPATFAGLCLAGAADGAAGHAINAWLTDADASIKGAVRDGGIGCAIALLTAGIGNLLKRARNAIGNNGPTTNPDGPGTRTDGDDGNGGNRDGEDGPGCTGTQCVPCNSFPTGTQVRMGNGTLKPIEQIEPGDYVLAHDLETGQWRPQLVLDQWSHLDNGHMATATIQDGSQVTATDHHMFWVDSNQQWLELDQIQPGNQLLSPNGPVEVLTLDVADATNTLVWELTVNTDHNFTVSTGTADVLVHNASCDGFGSPRTNYVDADDAIANGTQVQGRFPTTAGPDDVLYRANSAGEITYYQVYDSQGRPVFRADLTSASAPHAGIAPPHIQTYDINTAPNGREFVNKGDVRAASPDEIPSNAAP